MRSHHFGILIEISTREKKQLIKSSRVEKPTPVPTSPVPLKTPIRVDFKPHLPEFLCHILEFYEDTFQLADHHLHVAADAFSRAGGLRGVPGRSSAEGHPLQGNVGPVANRLRAWGSQVGVHVFGYKEPQCY